MGSSTFSSAVIRESRLNPWKTNPIFFLRMPARASLGRIPTSSPSRRYVPLVGRSRHPRRFMSVDFPDPDCCDDEGAPRLQVPVHELGKCPVAGPGLYTDRLGLPVLADDVDACPRRLLFPLGFFLLRGRPVPKGGAGDPQNH